jgi:hypothetical protein
MASPRAGGRSAPPKAPAPPSAPGHTLTAAERTLVDAYCHTGGDLAEAARRAKLPIEVARVAMRSAWWQPECRGYWREHAPTLAQATVAIRDVLADPDAPSSVRVAAARVAMEHHIAERAVGALEDLVGLARSGTSDRLIAEMARRNLLRLPPEQHRIAVAHAERLLDASEVTESTTDATQTIDADYAVVPREMSPEADGD